MYRLSEPDWHVIVLIIYAVFLDDNKEQTRTKLHNTLTLPALLYGRENWTIKSKRRKKNNSRRWEIYEKDSRIYLNRLYDVFQKNSI